MYVLFKFAAQVTEQVGLDGLVGQQHYGARESEQLATFGTRGRFLGSAINST